MATLLQFSQNIRKRGSDIENGAVALVKKTAKESLRYLIDATPVDTGQARSNWRVSLVNRTFAVIPPYAPGVNLGRGERANARAALAAGIAEINKLRAGPSRRGAGSAVFITNNVPYIELLNSGSSKQHPGGFVEGAALIASTVIRNFRLLRRDS